MSKTRKLTQKKRVYKNKYENSAKNIKGGKVFGEGAFSVVLGEPHIPIKYSSSRTNTSTTRQDDDQYVSKIFFKDSNYNDFINVVNILHYFFQGEKYNELSQYLVLPKIVGNDVIFKIDKDKYQDPDGIFQTNEYWMSTNGVSYYDKTRLKLYNAKEQVLYPKSDMGSLDKLDIKTYDDVIQMLISYKNIAIGISLLHTKDLIHHDIKPDNILIFTKQSGYIYKIADLDTILPIDAFNNTEKKKNSFHISRLFDYWAYQYFPSSIILLFDAIDNPSLDNTISATRVESELNVALIKHENQSYCNLVSTLFFNAIKKLNSVGVKNDRPIIRNLLDILSEKYGISKEGDYELMSQKYGTDESKLKHVKAANKKIANALNANTTLTMTEKQNILLKYIDVYAFFYSILEKLLTFISICDNIELELKKLTEYEKIMDVCRTILTHKYFEQQEYKNNILQLYYKYFNKETTETRTAKFENLLKINDSRNSSNYEPRQQPIVPKYESRFELSSNLDVYHLIAEFAGIFNNLSLTFRDNQIYSYISPINIEFAGKAINHLMDLNKDIPKFYHNLLNQKHFNDMIYNWFDIYKPTCITLLLDIDGINRSGGNINDITTYESKQKLGQTMASNLDVNNHSTYLYDLFKNFKSTAKSKLSDSVYALIMKQLDNILLNKYGTHSEETSKLNLGMQGHSESNLQLLIDSNNDILSYLLDFVSVKNCSTINKDEPAEIYNFVKLLLEYVNIYNITMILLVELVKFIINTDTKFTDNLCIVISKIFSFCATILTTDYFQKGICCNEINTYYYQEVAKLGISRHTLNNVIFVDTAK